MPSSVWQPDIYNRNKVWDDMLMDWVPETQPGGGGGGTVDQGTGGISPWLVHVDNSSFAMTNDVLTDVHNITDHALTTEVIGSVNVTGLVTASISNDGTFALESGGHLQTIDGNTAPLLVSNAGGYIRQDSTATMALESGGNLATLAGKDFATESTLALVSDWTSRLAQPQGAAAEGVQGPLVQALVSYAPPVYDDAVTAPQSLNALGQTRVITVTEDSASGWDPFEDTGWNLSHGAMNFDTRNLRTIDSAWES